MRGLEVPAEVVEELGGGPRPRVTITINNPAVTGFLATRRTMARVRAQCGAGE
jgi:hypothetical protein